ncbi:MAG: preprotein translocase subunit SecG [Candidatus Omnitrophica bacterium]|nr:preprotein translocase subunit SecG [Candidatus Omnitrophota bacterium]
MMTFVLIIHSITCALLVLVVLMQAGRGGGLTESFSSAESVFGAQTSDFMVRTTSILAAVFFVTSLSLAYLSSHQSRSLMATDKERSKAVQSSVKQPLTKKDVAKEVSANMVAPNVNQVMANTQAQ